MAGFFTEIPYKLFSGARIEFLIVGASSLKLALSENRSILLYYFGSIEDKSNWLYNLPLCGSHSLQSLVGDEIDNINAISNELAEISLVSGRVIELHHDDVCQDLVNFKIGLDEYIA